LGRTRARLKLMRLQSVAQSERENSPHRIRRLDVADHPALPVINKELLHGKTSEKPQRMKAPGRRCGADRPEAENPR